MPDENRTGYETGTQWIVYALDSDATPAHMLEVCEDSDAADEAVDKWWRAFESGEKKEPEDYQGVNKRPVVGFDEWPAGDAEDHRELEDFVDE